MRVSKAIQEKLCRLFVRREINLSYSIAGAHMGEAMRPLIGVIPLWDEKKNSIWMVPGYMDGIEAAGGTPVILPFAKERDSLLQLVGLCDGFLFTGGQDVDPGLYGQERREKCGVPCTLRDELEREVFLHARRADKPMFGICRGIQVFNVLCGGTLYQDLPSEYPCKVEHHMEPPYDRVCHMVEIFPGTPLAKWLGCKRMGVNSYHHQAVRKLAPELEPMAVSEDGLTEAVWLPEARFAAAVQWHPELNFQKEFDSRRLFEVFVKACR